MPLPQMTGVTARVPRTKTANMFTFSESSHELDLDDLNDVFS